jgi:hypothetical protein
MQATRIERMSLTSFFVAGWMAFFSAAIAHAQPLYASPPPPQPPPIFNPSTPYTVPQSPETPVSPGLPTAVSRSSAFVLPSMGSTPRAVAGAHRRRVTVTGTSHVTDDKPWQHVRSANGECAVHSKPLTDATPSGILVRVDADAS